MTTLVLAVFVAGCDSSITQPSLADDASIAFAKGGSSDAAKACRNNGYLNVQGADGTLFRNVGECVRFVAQGGVPQPIGGGLPSITSLAPVEGSNNCTVTPWIIDFVAVFSGGTGTLNGTPIISGVALTIPMSPDNLYTLVVTNGTTMVTRTETGFVCT